MKHAEEWKAIQAEALAKLKAESYESLAARIGSAETTEVTGASGTTYSVRVMIFWDGFAGGDLRLICAIDSGGLSAMLPKSASLIMYPNGSVDE